MNREKELVKNSAILSIGTVLPKLTSLITLPVITGCLTTEEYGTYDLITILVSLILPIATLQMQAAAFRFLVDVRDNKDEQSKVVTNILSFTIPVSVTTLLILYFLLFSITPQTRLLVLTYFFVDILLATVRQIARGLALNLTYSISALLNSVAEMLLMIAFLIGLDRGLNGALLALIISQLISLVYICIRSKVFSFCKLRMVSLKKIKELLSYSWAMIPNSLSSWVMRVSDRLILTLFMGVEANAIYAVANKLPNIFGIVQSTFSLAWQENATLSVDDSDSGEYYGSMFDNIFNILVGCMAILIAFTPVIFKLLIRGDYDESYNHFAILYIAYFFSGISSYMGGIYIAHMKSKEIGLSTTLAAVTNFLINIIFVNYIGIYAASISTLVSYLWLALYRMHDVQKFQKIKFKKKKIFFCVFLLCLMSFACFARVTYLDIINMILSLVVAIRLNYNIICAMIDVIKKTVKIKRK